MRRFELGRLSPLLAASALADAPVADGIVHVPVRLSAGDRAEMVLERVKENSVHASRGWAPERTRSVELLEIVGELREGFLLRATTLESTAEGGNPAALGVKRALGASSISMAIEIETTARGTPTRIRDWRGLVAAVAAELEAVVRDGGLAPAVGEVATGVFRAMVADLDDARATATLGEPLALWSAFHGFRLEEGGTYSGWSVEPALLSGDPVELTYDFGLVGMDMAAGLARIEVRQTASPESTAALVDGLVARVGQGLGQPLPDEATAGLRAQLDEAGDEIELLQSFEIGPDDGWTRLAVDERRSTFGGAGGRHLTRLAVRRLP